MTSLKQQRFVSGLLKNIIGIGMCMIIIVPILIVLFASIKTSVAMSTTSTLLPPPRSELTWSNYRTVFSDSSLVNAFKVSLEIAFISIFFNIILGSLTAYCLDRFNFVGKKILFSLFFLGMMVPTNITEIARFGIITKIHAYNTIAAPIIIYVASDLMQLYIFLQFISKIPTSLDESAEIDGCSYFRIFWQIIFPLLLPASATVAIIKFVGIINDMYVPYLYMPKKALRTLTTFLMGYSDSLEGSWQILSSAIIVIMLPTIIVYIFAQRYIMDGLTAGAVKE